MTRNSYGILTGFQDKEKTSIFVLEEIILFAIKKHKNSEQNSSISNSIWMKFKNIETAKQVKELIIKNFKIFRVEQLANIVAVADHDIKLFIQQVEHIIQIFRFDDKLSTSISEWAKKENKPGYILINYRDHQEAFAAKSDLENRHLIENIVIDSSKLQIVISDAKTIAKRMKLPIKF